MEVTLIKNEVPLKKGKQELIRKEIELMVEERLGGLFLELQENTDHGDFRIYLHTDTYNYLPDEEIEQLAAMRITDDPEMATEGLKRLLNIDFRLENTKSKTYCI